MPSRRHARFTRFARLTRLGAVATFLLAAACGKSAVSQPATTASAASAAKATPDDGSKPVASAEDGPRKSDDRPVVSTAQAAWVGAATESEAILRSSRDTLLGVWVDVPEGRPKVRAPVDVALVVDTSGSMAGAKIENARSAARQLVQNLQDGDIVSLDSFSDTARVVVPPTKLDVETRPEILRAIATLGVGGSTNMFSGLTLGQSHMQSAPPTHTVRRVVVISDGIANVGPSTPEALGAIAERGLRFRAQVTSLGVGADYDEHTLNALAVKSSGRLYHLSDPKEMAQTLRREVELVTGTIASDAVVEVVPAPGVQLIGADGIRTEWGEGGALRIPIGALHGGQRREALVRVRVVDPRTMEGASSRPIASVRLKFKDPADGDLERIQETVARATMTDDAAVVARSVNARTRSIAAIWEVAHTQLQVAQQVNSGQFVDADRELERAQKKLETEASKAKDDAEKRRLTTAAAGVASQRAAVGRAAAAPAPKAAARDEALKMNSAAMDSFGF